MNKQFFNIDDNKNGNRRNNTIRNSTKSPSIRGDFSRRPPHTPPKGSDASTKGKKNK